MHTICLFLLFPLFAASFAMQCMEDSSSPTKPKSRRQLTLRLIAARNKLQQPLKIEIDDKEIANARLKMCAYDARSYLTFLTMLANAMAPVHNMDPSANEQLRKQDEQLFLNLLEFYCSLYLRVWQTKATLPTGIDTKIVDNLEDVLRYLWSTYAGQEKPKDYLKGSVTRDGKQEPFMVAEPVFISYKKLSGEGALAYEYLLQEHYRRTHTVVPEVLSFWVRNTVPLISATIVLVGGAVWGATTHKGKQLRMAIAKWRQGKKRVRSWLERHKIGGQEIARTV